MESNSYKSEGEDIMSMSGEKSMVIGKKNQLKLVAGWNKKYPEGTEVIVKKDNGAEIKTKTRSEAWLLGGHTAVILLEGISGCYALERIRLLYPGVGAK